MGSTLGVAVAFSAGLFSFLSPCVLPLFPSYISFITGMSVGDLTGDLGASARRRVLLHALAFVIGFSLVFVALGASLSAASQALFRYRDAIRIVGGLLIIVFGLYIAGVLRIGFLGRTASVQIREKPAGYIGSFIVGVTFAVGWTDALGQSSARSCRWRAPPIPSRAASGYSSRTRRGSACRSCSRRWRSVRS